MQPWKTGKEVARIVSQQSATRRPFGMTILITGANGFTGAQVAKTALQSGIPVRGYVREQSNLERLKGLNISLHKGDITSGDDLYRALKGVETVIHTAAYVALGVVDQTEMARVNIEGTRAVLQASLAAGVKRFVHCSTIGIFGDSQGQISTKNSNEPRSAFLRPMTAASSMPRNWLTPIWRKVWK